MIPVPLLRAAVACLALIGTPLSAQVETVVPRLRVADYGPNVSDRIRETLLASEAGDPLLGAKIIGGTEAIEGENPWQAALIIGRTEDAVRVPFCGGSLIAPRWVLTAAHCVDNRTDPGIVDVVTGSIDLPAGQRTRVNLIVIHRDWTRGPRSAPLMLNDVALLRLSAPVTVAPIALASPTSGPELERGGVLTRVTGWGTTAESGALENRLRTLNIPVVTNNDCNNRVAYGDTDPQTPPLVDTMMCAGFAAGGFDACQGDSGGPLTGPTDTGRLLLGIVSWGKGCGRQNKYGVYTRVSAYSDWITDCIAGRDCPRQ